MTGLSAKFSDATADITPAAIPDVYRDEPLVLAAKLDRLVGSVEIKGKIGDRPWVVTLPIANAAEGKGLSKLWARRKISDAEVARTLRQVSPEEADKTILSLALEHQLVTRLTSLVAVDQTPTRPDGEPLTLAALPINLPAGWDFEKVFGERPHLPSPPKERRTEADGRVHFAAANASGGRSPARYNHAAEDGDRCRAQHDPWLGAADAQHDPVRVQPASDVGALMPGERRRLPSSSFGARGSLVPQGRARNFSTTSFRDGPKDQTRNSSRFRVRCCAPSRNDDSSIADTT